MSDPTFRPEVWAPAALQAMRDNLSFVTWKTLTEAESAERVAAWKVREAARTADITAMEQRLAALPDVLQPIIALHAHDGRRCTGCDVDGYESEQPEWPCRTIKTILGEPIE